MSKTTISPIIAGAMNWGIWDKNLNTKEMENMIHLCVENKITTFDHADIYGDYTTETDFGKAFSSSKIKQKTFELIKNVELKKSWSYYISTKTNSKTRAKRLWMLPLLAVLGFITFFSRYYFTKYDLYALSNLWILELETVIDFDKQRWFYNGVTPVGELALINFYSKISSISPEIALESIGIIESVLIAILIFWTISKVTASKLIAPIFGCLFF